MIIADGFSGSPFNTTGAFSYVSRTLEPNNKFEVGDPYYNI